MILGKQSLAIAGTILLCTMVTAEDFDTALSALERFSTSGRPSATEPVVGMVGFFGQSQPPQWLVLTDIPSRKSMVRESVVSRGEVRAERMFRKNPAQDLPDVPLERADLKIDSDRAFRIVEQVAHQQRVSFESAHFQLRCRDQGGEPVWMLSLNSLSQVSLGVVYVSAKTGEVLRVSWVRPKGDLDRTSATPRS